MKTKSSTCIVVGPTQSTVYQVGTLVGDVFVRYGIQVCSTWYLSCVGCRCGTGYCVDCGVAQKTRCVVHGDVTIK